MREERRSGPSRHIACCAAQSSSETTYLPSICRNDIHLQQSWTRDNALRLYSLFWKDSNSDVFLNFFFYCYSPCSKQLSTINIIWKEKKKYLSNIKKKKKDSGKRHLALATRHRRRRRHEGLVAGRFWRFYGMGWGLNWSKGA